MWDDILDEQVENSSFYGPMGGLLGFVSPEKTNSLMGETRADDQDYWEKYDRAAVGARVDLMEAEKRYAEEQRKAAKKNAIGGA
jgi:hypothetical protein